MLTMTTRGLKFTELKLLRGECPFGVFDVPAVAGFMETWR